MKIRNISTLILFLLLAMYCGVVTHAASLDEAWEAMQNSQYEKAHTQFGELRQGEHDESALRGLLLCAAAQGNYPRMAENLSRLIREYPASSYLSCYLAFGSMAGLQGWTARERLKVFDSALEKEMPASHRQWLEYERAETLDMLLDRETKEAARKAGVLVDHWNIVGPFGRYGASDFFRSFGPEVEWKETYSGWQKDTEIEAIQYPDMTGLVDFDGLLNPSTGVAYAMNVIEADEAAEGLLTIHSPSDFRVWWNGEPVAWKSHQYLDTRRVVSVPVSLEKGKNLLVIKARKYQSWWLRAKLQSQGDEELPIRSVPFKLNEISHCILKPFDRVAQEAMQKSYTPEFDFLDDETNPYEKGILISAWYLDRHDYEQVNELLGDVLETAPESSLAHEWHGDVNLRLANERRGSRSRFQQIAEKAYRKALDLDPHCKGALIGLMTYFMDRDQTDQALDLINEHISEYPEVMKEAYAGALHYAYGGLYTKKQFVVEAARNYLKALGGTISSEKIKPPIMGNLFSQKKPYLPSYEMLRHLISFYDGNKNVKQAVNTIVQGLKLFPAYTPFLEKALRFPEETMKKMDVDELLRRANALHPYEIRYAILRGNLLENLGQYQQALDWYETLQDRFPGNPRVEEWKASLAYTMDQEEKAERIYTTLHEQYPIRQKPFRFLRDVVNQENFAYMKYDVQLEDIDTSKAEIWNNSRASVIYLLDIMVMELYEDGTYDQYIHQAMKIMNQEGMRKWAEVVIPQGGNVEIIKARTITKDGAEWAVSDVQDLSGQQSLSMYGVEEGAIVEYAYLQRSGRDDPGLNVTSGGYFFGSDDDPMQLSKLTIVQHDGAVLNLAKNPLNFDAKITKEEGKTIYEWENRMQDGLKAERFGPPLAERVPSLQWSTCPDWMLFAERQRATIPGYEEESEEIKELANTLKEESGNAEAFVHKVYRWIQDNIEESGGGQTTADTVALRAGGRYQKLRLMRHLLRLGEVESHLAIALENDENDGFRPLPFPSYPGHTLLVVSKQEGIEERLAADFTSRFAPLNNIDPMVEKMVLFVYDTDTPYFEPLRSELWEAGLLRRKLDVEVLTDRTANIKGRYIYDVLYDKQIREALTNPEVEKRLADSQLSRDLPGIQVDSYEFEYLEDLSQAPQMNFKGKVPDIVKPESGNEFSLRPVLDRTQASNFVTEPTRETPIVFQNSPIRSPFEARFDMSEWIDAGARFVLPGNTFIINEYGYFSLFIEWEGSTLVVRRSLLIPPQEIEPKKYEGFVEFCRTIDQVEDRTIKIIPLKDS